MSHQDGKIFIDTTTTPHTGVSVADVQQVLRRGTGDVGLLCSDKEWHNNGTRENPDWVLQAANKINKWAKFKPVRHTTLGVITVAQRLTALHGLQLPRYSASDFKTHYSDAWAYLPPRGKKNTTLNPTSNDEWFRLRDFDGYTHEEYPMLGPVSSDGLTYGFYTIFDGYISTPRTRYIYPGDLITFYLKCKEEQGDESGRLFPYDFYREQQSFDDISKYYIGIALLVGSTLWVITGDQMLSHISSGDTEAFLSVNVPTSITPGSGAKVIPMLASSQYASWDDAPGNGYFLGLNGAFITRDIGSASQKLTIGVVITHNNGSVTMAFTLTNNTSSDVVLKNLVAFISSAESFYNEGDSAHNPPTTGGYGIREYLADHWDAASAENVPPFSAMGLTNPPDVYLSDWISGIGSPAYLVGKGYNAQPDFKSNNGNSTTIQVGHSVTWSKTMNIGQDDGCGYYSDGIFVSVCAFVNMSAYIEEFTNL